MKENPVFGWEMINMCIPKEGEKLGKKLNVKTLKGCY